MVKVINNASDPKEIETGTVFKWLDEIYMIVSVHMNGKQHYTLMDIYNTSINLDSKGTWFETVNDLVNYYSSAIYYQDKDVALCIDDY